jgi:hypothetical protein
MGEPLQPPPVLLVIAAFSRHLDALALARQWLEHAYGPIALTSPLYEFNQTRYYEEAMGPNLRKQLFAFQELVAEDCLPEVKLLTNALEAEILSPGSFPEPRPLNLDPGILTEGKFLLATTKDKDHRLYLRSGIYAEVTLRYHAGAYEPWPWTYADYRLPEVRNFLREARQYYRQRLGRST